MLIENQKKEMRAGASATRSVAHAACGDDAPLALVNSAFPVAPEEGRNVVSGFYPYQTEISVLPLLGKLAGEGWVTSLPVVLGTDLPLEFRRWYPGQPTQPGMWKIPRPLPEAPVVEPDVLLVPMLAFDAQGYRLGYGGGFYDRTLALLRAKKPIVAIGVAYSAQAVSSVPHGPHDQPLDYVLTERDIIRF